MSCLGIKNRLVCFALFFVVFGCNGVKLMSDAKPQDPSAKTPSIPALETFIFEHDEYKGEIVPRKLSPPEVARFLIGKIEKKTELRPIFQTVKVVEFYDTHEVVEKFKSFLDKSESGEEDVRRSIAFARIIARVGNKDDLEFAKQYYVYLVGRADSLQEFNELTMLYEALGLGGNSTELRHKIGAKQATLEPKKGTDFQASLEYNKLNDIGSYALVRAEGANKLKDKITGISDRDQRLDEEVKAYLTVEYGYIEFLRIWAAQRLRRETWAAQPQQQILRPENPPLTEDVIKAFRRFLDKFDQNPKIKDEAKLSPRICSLRAIKFFGGKISEQEESFLIAYKNEQSDILANEGFMLSP
jgi:hypothetical protein